MPEQTKDEQIFDLRCQVLDLQLLVDVLRLRIAELEAGDE